MSNFLSQLRQSLMTFLRLSKPYIGEINIGDWGTEGPAEADHPWPTVPPMPDSPTWQDGWYSLATRMPANPGRVGLPITPRNVVVHTTDMMPDSWDALLKALVTTRTSGACAHFFINRDGTVVQMVPITRNGNHAGGPIHGNYRDISTGTLIHPNTCSVGIELHGAGNLDWKDGKFIHRDTKSVIPPSEVYTSTYPGMKYFQNITLEQFNSLRTLLQSLLKSGLNPSLGYDVVPDGKYSDNQVVYADQWGFGSTIVGHASLDPVNKSDPGPQVMDWLRAFWQANRK